MHRIDITGQRFGRLTALSYASGHWRCRCDCGRTTTVRSDALRYGTTVSCGCYREERNVGNNFGRTHGGSGMREYASWKDMKARCSNPRDTAFSNYGKRGIRICRHWLGPNGFTNFLADMGKCPPGLTLDRIDNAKGYFPSNCRWSTRKQQQRNRRTTLRVTIAGKTKAFGDWVDHFNIVSFKTAHSRYLRGWTPEAALTTQISGRKASTDISGTPPP
jgi:hypothetical protein